MGKDAKDVYNFDYKSDPSEVLSILEYLRAVYPLDSAVFEGLTFPLDKDFVFSEELKERLEKFKEEYHEWSLSRRKINQFFYDELMNCNEDLNNNNLVELGKRAPESVIDFQTRLDEEQIFDGRPNLIITPYIHSGFNQANENNISCCDENLVFIKPGDNKFPHIRMNGEVDREVFITNPIYLSYNPYSFMYSDFPFLWLPNIHKHKKGRIVMAIYGHEADKDMEDKVEALNVAAKTIGFNDDTYRTNSARRHYVRQDGMYCQFIVSDKEHVRKRR